MDGVVGNRQAAVVADEVDLNGLAARVPADEGRSVHGPFVAPLVEGEHHREQFPAGLGEVVLVTRRVFAVLAAFDDPGSLEFAQTVREDVARRARLAGNAGEAVYAVADLT